MPKLKLTITGPAAIGGKNPGDVFNIEADEDGVPLDIFWRRRLRDEDLYAPGAVARVLPEPVLASPPEPVAPPDEQPPAKTSKKGS
jgi:hypothetical protein